MKHRYAFAALALVGAAACSKSTPAQPSAAKTISDAAALTASIAAPRPAVPVNAAQIRNVDQPVTFGNVTSQSFGLEGGVTVAPRLQVFGELGKVRDTSPDSLGAGAQFMAAFLSRTQGSVAFGVKQPVTSAVGGVRYVFPSAREPYALGGFGLARAHRDVTFTVGGTDVTTTLAQLGVVLGTDLSGSETKPMISVGGGVAWPAWKQLVLDFQFRYGGNLTEAQGTNVAQAGIGVGVRF